VTTSRAAPSLRARAARRALVAGLELLRGRSGGLPAPDAPFEDLERYVLEMRTRAERFLARVPTGRDVEVVRLLGAPVSGLAVALRTHREPPADRAGFGEWLAAAPRVILHLHGGGYFMGSSVTHRGFGAALARVSDAVVVLPDYRLVPEHPYPAALDDAEAVARWLTETCGVDPARLAVTGDSAGGGLAAGLLVRLRDQGAALPACYVGMSPWLDLAGTGESVTALDGIDPWIPAAMLPLPARFYAGELELDDPQISPLYADLSGLPPSLVFVGGDELLLDDAVRFTARARAAGVAADCGVYPGLWHVFPVFPGLPESRDVLAEVGGFVRRHTDVLCPTSRG
jgi:epsilon-lactone hydrolase